LIRSSDRRTIVEPVATDDPMGLTRVMSGIRLGIAGKREAPHASAMTKTGEATR